MICYPVGAIVALALAVLCVLKVVAVGRPEVHATPRPFVLHKDQSRVPHTNNGVVTYWEGGDEE